MLLTESRLDEWVRANPEAAQGLIVETVWRLVAASSPNPRERRFPLGDSVGQHGRDGILEVDLGFEPYFPDGRSSWEIGTGIDPAGKATDDYRHATKAVPEPERSQSALIVVTPLSGRRGWDAEAQARWLVNRRARGDWREVRVIDGTILVDWLHQFPSVEIWLAEATIGIRAPDIDTFDSRWDVLKSYGEPPPLTPDLFLLNRDAVRTKLDAILDKQTARLRLETLYTDQAADFVTAHLAGLAAEARVDAASRALFVSSADAWKRLCELDTQHILITEAGLDLSGDDGTKLIQLAQRGGHAVIHSGLPGGLPDPTSAPLPPPRVEQIEEALRTAGHSQERSHLLAERSAGNLASLKRMLQNLAALPDWADGSGAADLAIGLMLGGWKESSPADVETVEAIAGNSYGAWIDRVRAQSFLAGAPLTQSDGVWKFGPRYEGWYALGPRIFRPELERTREWVTRTLGETDPQLELSDEDLPLASVRGHTLQHSDNLRRGLADTVALLGSHDAALRSLGPGEAAGAAYAIVRQLLGEADWKRIASLDRLLPVLAEGSPEAFLHAIESLLRLSPGPFDTLYSKETSGMLGRTYMSGTLWALETLAWRPEYLGRVVLILGQLASRDPGGSWSNRASNSLTTILLPWMPQTLAPVDLRLAAFNALAREEREVAWTLLMSLLPRQTQVSSGSRKPTWRAWIPDDWSGQVTVAEYREQVELYAARAVDIASSNVQMLVALIDHMDTLPAAARERVLAHLRSDSIASQDDALRAPIWAALTRLVSRHRLFADADWAMEPSVGDDMAEVAELLAPTRPDLYFARLFTDHGIDLFEKKGDYARQHELLETRRDDAVRQIFTESGLPGVQQFAAAVGTPWRVGLGMGRIGSDDSDHVILPEHLTAKDTALREFGRGYVSGRFAQAGWDWIDGLHLTAWPSGELTSLFAILPFTPDTWDRVDRLLENSDEYWSLTHANPYGYKADVTPAIDRLLGVGRPFAALRCIHYVLATEGRLLAMQAIVALRDGLVSTETRDQMSSFEVTEVLKALQGSGDVSPDDLLQLEWAYLPSLDEDSGTTPVHLERRLADDPGFFSQILNLVFKGNPDDEQEARNPALAANGYRLLTDWSIPPGLQEDGSFDGKRLTTWLEEVGERSRSSGREAVAMTMAGHVLIHVPADPNGFWIDLAAAHSLDGRDADDLRDGFRSAELNSRGVHFVNPSGEDERELAEKYRLRAEALDAEGFHRFAGTLRELESNYRLEAQEVRRREW